MPKFKENHIISECLLKQWNTQGSNYNGVHIYDIIKKEFQFSNGKGGSAFSFTIEPNFYIHEVDGNRYTEIEELFGKWEDTLARVAAKVAKNEKVNFLNDRNTFDLFFKAILSLKFRTKGFIISLKKYLDSNGDIKNLLEKDNTKDIKLIALETAINSLNEVFLSFDNCEIFILYDKTGELIIGDEPFVGCDFVFEGGKAMLFDEFSAIALSPYHLIRFNKNHFKTVFKFMDIPDEVKEVYNNIIAEQSRYWIAARDKSTLQKYCDIANEERTPLEFSIREANFIESYFRIRI